MNLTHFSFLPSSLNRKCHTDKHQPGLTTSERDGSWFLVFGLAPFRNMKKKKIEILLFLENKCKSFSVLLSAAVTLGGYSFFFLVCGGVRFKQLCLQFYYLHFVTKNATPSQEKHKPVIAVQEQTESWTKGQTWGAEAVNVPRM